MISGIVCCDKNWGIGKQNGLLFNIPADMRHFVKLTKGTVVVMGYSTYLSLPKRPLSNRLNIVLWAEAPSLDCLDGCITFSKFDELVKFIKVLDKSGFSIFICGGASVYKLFLPYYDTLYITKVDAEDKEATAFFPNLDENPNFFEAKDCRQYCESNGYKIIFTRYFKYD